MSAPVRDPQLATEVYQLDQTLELLGERLQRVLTAVAMTLDARRAVVGDQLAVAPGVAPADGVDVALFGVSAAGCRDLVKSLASA
jgi:hypothetical protein